MWYILALIPIAFVVAIIVGLVQGGVELFKTEKEAAIGRVKQQRALERENYQKFFNECAKYGINSAADLSDENKLKRATLIANNFGFKNDGSLESLQKLFKAGNEKISSIQQKERQEQHDAAMKKERAKFAELTFYASLHGKDKPDAMFSDKAKEYTAQANGTSFIPTRRESDGMFMAGAAAGIGGAIPALASLSNTAQYNDEVRRHNEAANTMNMLLAEGAMAARNLANKWRRLGNEISMKMVDESVTREQAFEKLRFSGAKVRVATTGTATVTANVRAEDVEAFGTRGFVDGSVIGEIYAEGKKVGEAIMVLPLLGTDSNRLGYYNNEYLPGLNSKDEKQRRVVAIEGMCLNCCKGAQSGCTVKFAPGDLWVMDALSDEEIKRATK
jgi:hypothetical protein